MGRKCLIISTVGADNTGAGGAVGVYGNAASIKFSGYDVLNLVIGKEAKIYQDDIPVQYISPEVTDFEKIEQVGILLQEFKPDLVWLHHYWVWDYFLKYANEFPFVLLSGDPDWELTMLHWTTKKLPSNPARRLRAYIQYQLNVKQSKKRELMVFRQAQERRGILACWCPSSVPQLQQKFGRVESCSLAFPDWGQRTEYDPKYLLMLGNVNGAHTRNGLKYFFKKIWNEWVSLASEYDCPQIRMVGGGKVPESISLPENSKVFERVGFVEDLNDEWVSAFATLVPVEAELGFRTRIVESWSKGVPVIAHASAKASLPQAEHKMNILFFDNAHELKEAVDFLKISENYNQIVESARSVFKQYYLVSNAFMRFDKLSQMALDIRTHDNR